MVQYNQAAGKYVNSDGKHFDSHVEAQMTEGFEGAIGAGIEAAGRKVGEAISFVLINVVPWVFTFLISGVLRTFIKMGVVGKAILTALTVFFWYWVYLSVFAALMGALVAFFGIESDPESDFFANSLYTISYISSFLTGAWFWLIHYKYLKKVDFWDLSFMLYRFLTICFWAPIAGIIIGSIVISLAATYISMKLGLLMFGAAFVVFFAIITMIWVKKVHGYVPTPIDDNKKVETEDE